MKLSSLSILIPAYNVQGTIKSVVRDAYSVGKKVAETTEIIVIDDGSTDLTNRILRSVTPAVPHMRIINHDVNRGYGYTIKELYITGAYEWLYSLPGDDQFDAGELLKLLPATENADMILGWRKTRNDSLWRLFQSTVYNGLLNMFFGLHLHDVNTIRLMKKSLINSMTLTSGSAFVDAELAIRAKRSGYTVVEIPVTHKERAQKGATGGKIFSTILPTVVDMIRMVCS
jgi:glycosyltransferase involved in cell wall biosynthesis